MSLFQRCVVGVDGSEGSAAAFGWAVTQAGSGGEVVAVHAFSPGAELLAAVAQVNLDSVRAEHERLLQHEWIAAAKGTSVHVDTEIVNESASAALLSSSTQHGDAPIVIGHQPHRWWNRRGVGHVAGELLHHANTPVIMINQTVVPSPIAGPVVVAVHEPADMSHPPIAWAATLAEERQLALHVVSVALPLVAGPGHGYSRSAYEADTEAVQKANQDATKQLADLLTRAHPTVTITSQALFGHPIDELTSAISDVDGGVVVIGSHHPSALISFVTDGVARRLPPLMTCPVISVPVA